MNLRKDGLSISLATGLFLIVYYLPVERIHFSRYVTEALFLARWYAREHVLLCLIPAFFIAGAIAVFVSRNSILKYLGPAASKLKAYGVASISGSVLAVCSCTILPLFAGIYRMGAGLGPATAFLYAGPAVNILAIVLTARILGLELGIARAIGAVVFSVVIGIIMQLIFKNERQQDIPAVEIDEKPALPLWKNIIYFATMISILVIANWHGDSTANSSFILDYKWYITAGLGIGLGLILIGWFRISRIKIVIVAAVVTILSCFFSHIPVIPFTAGAIGLSIVLITSRGEAESWFDSTWDLTRQILPLLLIGVLVAGALLGRPDHPGLIPPSWIERLVGGNSFTAVFFASIVGAFMYFATLTEIPILQGLMAGGMGKGPALALLLSGPALSLPNMLVIRSIMGTKKTVIFVALVVIMATATGMIYGTFF